MSDTRHPAEHTREDQRRDKVAEKQRLEEKRCESCNHLLMNHKVEVGVVQIKCPKCGHMNEVASGLSTK